MRSDPLRLRSDLLLLLGAALWGFAFVGQRVGMDHLGPFTFNAVRFAIGGLVLAPLILWTRARGATDVGRAERAATPASFLHGPGVLLGGLVTGVALFAGSTFQQVGIVYTTAGKAGFVTSLYVVLVPLLGLALGRRAPATTWLGALLAAAGLYFLTMQGAFRMALGDLLVLVGAFMWAGHVLLVGHFSPGRDPIRLAFVQFMTCAALSAVVALFVETATAADVRAAAGAILYTGILSIGVGYTLQVAGQRHAPPADAALLMSMESVFAVLGGWLLLGEQLTTRALIGCALMLTGIVVSQWPGGKQRTTDGRPLTSDNRPLTTDD